jgi:hypothetical protein
LVIILAVHIFLLELTSGLKARFYTRTLIEPLASWAGGLLVERYAGNFMVDIMYWGARCKKCGGMVGYRNIRYTIDALGLRAEQLPVGTIEKRCDHCGEVGVFDLRKFRPTSVKLLLPRLP